MTNQDVMDRPAVDWSVWFHYTAIVLGTIALLAGKFTTGRLPVQLLPDIDMRLPVLIVAFAFELIYIRRTGTLVRWRNTNLALVFVPLLAFAAYCILAESFVWHGGFRNTFFQDLYFMLALVALFGLMVRNEADLLVLAAVGELASLSLFLATMSQAGGLFQGLPELPTSVTMFRIQLVGLCSALYLLDRLSHVGWKLAHGAIVICCIYAALASASRTSILVLPCLFMAFGFYCIVVGRWRLISVMSGIIFAGVLVFVSSDRADLLTQRLSAISEPELAMQSQRAPNTPQSTVAVPDPMEEALLHLTDPEYLAYCQDSLQAISEEPIIADSYSCSGYVAIPDSTHRIRMALKAFELLAAHPVYGGGPDGFRLTLAYGELLAATYTYPHNLLLDIAARTGLLGLLVLLVSMLATVAVIVRVVSSNQSVIFLCGIPLIYALASFTGGDLYDARAAWVIVAAIAAICPPVSQDSARRARRHSQPVV